MKPARGETTTETTVATEEFVDSPYVFGQRFLGYFDWKEFACGCCAATANISVTYPISKIIFRQMLHGIPVQSAVMQLRDEGWKYLYRGILPPLAQKTIAMSIMFGVFGGTRRYLIQDFALNAHVASTVASIATGSAEAVLLPFERIQVLMAHSKYHGHFASTPLAFRYVYVNYGLAEFYRGLVPVLCRNGPSNAIFFTIREEAVLHRSQASLTRSMHMVHVFATGALIGATISSVFYPLNVIKVKMQSEMGLKAQSVWSTFKEIYRERGSRVRHFYNGVVFNSFRSFFSWGIMNLTYEMCRYFITTPKPKELLNIFYAE